LRVVKLTLLGSIIGNLLLVMGSAFVAGGIFHPSQTFNQQGINVNCGLLILAGVCNHHTRIRSCALVVGTTTLLGQANPLSSSCNDCDPVLGCRSSGGGPCFHSPALVAAACPAVVAVMLPTLISSTAAVVVDFKAELALSRFESVLMLICYGLFLVFQLVTHR